MRTFCHHVDGTFKTLLGTKALPLFAGMALQDNVAVVALVVSLVALFIALTQGSVQLFSTAEGYRKCAASIIGPWSSKRHRKWLWSEFRFETQYVTPHIALLNPADLILAGEKACLLSLQNGGDREKFPEVELPDLVKQDFKLIGRSSELLKNDILAQLGFREDLRITIIKSDRQILHNSIVTLLCTFLPQKGTPASNHYCWFWREASPFSVFHWWEGRFALLRGLRGHISRTPGLDGKAIHKVLEHWETLASGQPSGQYEADFFARWNDANLSQSGENSVKSMEYLDGLRGIFAWTTEYFRAIEIGDYELSGGATKRRYQS